MQGQAKNGLDAGIQDFHEFKKLANFINNDLILD